MKLFDLEALLRENDYPGRGIVLGRSADNACAVMVYFINVLYSRFLLVIYFIYSSVVV